MSDPPHPSGQSEQKVGVERERGVGRSDLWLSMTDSTERRRGERGRETKRRMAD